MQRYVLMTVRFIITETDTESKIMENVISIMAVYMVMEKVLTSEQAEELMEGKDPLS